MPAETERLSEGAVTSLHAASTTATTGKKYFAFMAKLLRYIKCCRRFRRPFTTTWLSLLRSLLSQKDPLALRTGLATGVPFVRCDLAGGGLTERRPSIHQSNAMLNVDKRNVKRFVCNSFFTITIARLRLPVFSAPPEHRFSSTNRERDATSLLP